MTAPSSVCLVVLDGWGLAPDGPGNAVSLADTPVFDDLWARFPHTTLTACGAAVGLPDGQMGNSEVGHLNLGAGAVVKQDLTLIDEAARQPAFGGNEVLLAALRAAPRVHVATLVSDGGVHSSMDHLHALLHTAAEVGVEDLVIHAFTDGRDTLPHDGAKFLATLEGWMRGGRARAASPASSGASTRWTATTAGSACRRPTTCSSTGSGEHSAPTASAAALAAYERGETDEFIAPTLVGEEGTIRPEDSVIAFNFRPDRMRELSARAGRAGLQRDRPPRPRRRSRSTRR